MKVIEYICCIENTDPYTLELQVAGLMWYAKKQGYTVVETQIDSIPNFDSRRDNLNIILYGESNPCDTMLVFDKNLIPESLLPLFEKKNLKLVEVPREVRESPEFQSAFLELKAKVQECERQERAKKVALGRKWAAERKADAK